MVQVGPNEVIHVGNARRLPRPSRRPRSTRRELRAPVDARGVFVTLASSVVLAASFLPWYDVSLQGPATGAATGLAGPLTLLDHGFGGWGFVVPLVAAAAVLGGVVDALVRAGQRGALASFVALRALVFAQLGVVIASLVMRNPARFTTSSVIPLAVHVRWPAWGAVAAAVVAIGGSLASSRRPSA